MEESGDVGFKVMSFEGVGRTAEFKLGQIIVGDEDFAVWNGDYIATVQTDGSQGQYFTYDPDLGWYYTNQELDEVGEDASEVVLPLNQAIYVYSAGAATLTLSGAVMPGDTEICVEEGVTITGNFTPATITLGDIVVGDEDYAVWNGDYIATIKNDGSQDQYFTYDPDMGWYYTNQELDEMGDNAADFEFAPNTAFYYYSASGAKLIIPSPLN